MRFTSQQPVWQSLCKFGLITVLTCSTLLCPGVFSKEPQTALETVELPSLPREAQATERLIRAGGPFPFQKDGMVFGNRERWLPAEPRGFYREYTVKLANLRNRGAHRIVCGGWQASAPDACYYTNDHYASFRRIVK